MSIRLLARMFAGIGLCAAAFAASAGPYSNLVIFGDSLSDSGNNAILLSQGPGGLPPVDSPGDGSYLFARDWELFWLMQSTKSPKSATATARDKAHVGSSETLLIIASGMRVASGRSTLKKNFRSGSAGSPRYDLRPRRFSIGI